MTIVLLLWFVTFCVGAACGALFCLLTDERRESRRKP